MKTLEKQSLRLMLFAIALFLLISEQNSYGQAILAGSERETMAILSSKQVILW